MRNYCCTHFDNLPLTRTTTTTPTTTTTTNTTPASRHTMNCRFDVKYSRPRSLEAETKLLPLPGTESAFPAHPVRLLFTAPTKLSQFLCDYMYSISYPRVFHGRDGWTLTYKAFRLLINDDLMPLCWFAVIVLQFTAVQFWPSIYCLTFPSPLLTNAAVVSFLSVGLTVRRVRIPLRKPHCIMCWGPSLILLAMAL